MTSPSSSQSPKPKCRVGVLVSGSGTNLQALIDATRSLDYPAEISVVVSNKKDAYALERARQAGIPTVVVPHADFPQREDFEKKMIAELEKFSIDLIALAGFMRVLTPTFVRHFSKKIMNIHPALLPSFPGTRAIEEAFNYGVKFTGVTVHFVDEGTDTGPIILQEIISIGSKDSKNAKETLESLTEKVHSVEHVIYPEAIRLYAEGRLHIKDRKVTIT
jgi:phosphoribosylglycinamide formyltransferase-1